MSPHFLNILSCENSQVEFLREKNCMDAIFFTYPSVYKSQC